MSLNCYSCDAYCGKCQNGMDEAQVICRIHGLTAWRLLKECPEASYEPGSDFVETLEKNHE